MKKIVKGLNIGLVVGLISLMATPASARSISLTDAGPVLWIFVIVGAVIVLLQLIPAMILFFSMIGSSTSLFWRRGKKVEEEAVLPGAEPVAVKK